jgi:predicted ATP-grasp superfamily ATP-dependent carboligase
MNSPVLILGAEPRISIPIARSLHRRAVPVDVTALSATEPHLWSRSIRSYVRLAGKDSPELHQDLARRISHQKYEMLIPATDAALAFIAEHDDSLRQLLYVACPPKHIIDRVLNKSITLEIASEAGVSVPHSVRVLNLNELEAAAQKLQFPVIAKPYHKNCETDFKVKHFQNSEALRKAFPHGISGGLLLQEYVPGEGVGIEVLMHAGDALATFQHRRLKEVPASGGAAAIAIAERPEPVLLDQAVRLLRALEWEGVAMVEFRYDRSTHRSALMEVNGRYWGTLALPINAGVDFPWYQWQLAHGQKPSVSPAYPVDLCWRWTAGYLRRWHGLAPRVLKQSLKRPAAVSQLVPNLVDLTSHDSLWNVTDPLPSIAEVLGEFGGLLRSDLRSVTRKIVPRRDKMAAMPDRVPMSQPDKEESKIGA